MNDGLRIRVATGTGVWTHEQCAEFFGPDIHARLVAMDRRDMSTVTQIATDAAGLQSISKPERVLSPIEVKAMEAAQAKRERRAKKG